MKFTFKTENMAVDLRCPNCYDSLGKDTENENPAYCGNCGEEGIKNPRGFKQSESDDGSAELHQGDTDPRGYKY